LGHGVTVSTFAFDADSLGSRPDAPASYDNRGMVRCLKNILAIAGDCRYLRIL
jgi:hypothetical protein